MAGPMPIVLTLAIAVYAALALVALRNRLLARVALREAIRRPAQSALVIAGLLTDRLAVLASFGEAQWIAGLYLGVGGGALAFILWVLALQRASPTRVANTMTVNPIAAALLAQQLVGEPITLNLVVGLLAVFAGIWIATTETAKLQVGRSP